VNACDETRMEHELNMARKFREWAAKGITPAGYIRSAEKKEEKWAKVLNREFDKAKTKTR